MSNDSAVDIRCLCGKSNQSVFLASAGMPLDASFCHCNACRSTSGMLCFSYLELKSKPEHLQGLSQYRVSENTTRMFCETCGTHVLAHLMSLDQWRVASGVIQHDGDVINVKKHLRVDETIDGGMSNFLPDIGDLLKQSMSERKSIDEQEVPHMGIVHPEGEQKLKGQCHCSGIQYFITPPNSRSRLPSSPWADLLVPYHSSSSENKNDIKWWLRCDETKYLAGLCSCVSCRLGAGFPIQSWAFVPKANIEMTDGSLLDFGAGTMRQYSSSAGVYREFCNRCGATVFWHCDERPDLIDVSVGLLGAASGALALEWLDWHTGRVSFAEEAQDRKLVDRLEHGLRDWCR